MNTEQAINEWAEREIKKADGAGWDLHVIENRKAEFERMMRKIGSKPWLTMQEYKSPVDRNLIRDMASNGMLAKAWDEAGNCFYAVLGVSVPPRLMGVEQADKFFADLF